MKDLPIIPLEQVLPGAGTRRKGFIKTLWA